ncbi:MAG: cytochrome c [Pseudomonadota bacterium]
MIRKLTIAAAALLALGAALAALVWLLNVRGDAPSNTTPGTTSSTAPATIERGAYLARAGNCMACHTVRGGTPFAGGRGIDTPFGTVYTSNLTPDPVHGIGSWSAADFWRAMHNGRSKDGRLLYPAFPYPNYTQVTREDSDALHAYLRSLPPAAQPNRAHALRWPYGTQPALAVWRALYFSPGVHEAEPAKSAEWNRGAYLVQGLGHCSACHTPRNTLGATDDTLLLGGGLIPMQNWYAPSLTSPAEAGVAGWSKADIVSLLKTGTSARGAVTGPMAEVVLHSTQHLSDADLGAMAVFLQALPQSPMPAQRAEGKAALPASPGGRLYSQHCAQCHGDNGMGVPGAYPPLAGNRAVTMKSTANLVQIVLNGGYAPATAGNPRPHGMPPFVLVLGDGEVAQVLSYMRNAWGNSAGEVSEFDVARVRGTRR